MLTMDQVNMTKPFVPLEAKVEPQHTDSSQEYLYILIVMSFYGIFLLGIMMGYMRSKRREKKSNMFLLYKDEEREWGGVMKTLPTISGLRSVQLPIMFSALQENMVPGLSCAICSMEGSSVSSESSSSDVHLIIPEEETDSSHEEGSEVLLNDNLESNCGSSENLNKT
ncbi:potassium voltage-gated channel subfamily E member 4 [Latimeria chalumnae]|uniref:Potassium voltage-gated channel subfamily E regulatory subunit 4 n=1 Tax=Latimeria chalumnae TaxID=7897 RepID=H3A3P8_LATCH|nr:PREDICTED: potassium voltage-gated channel subfamily E member 4 [Latimeria chalumnae]|eukprot:XP_006012760.1 PREDICTED: potassium voltage-gated channel subfamily E member 4 [Latimeria chalumnae]